MIVKMASMVLLSRAASNVNVMNKRTCPGEYQPLIAVALFALCIQYPVFKLQGWAYLASIVIS